MKMKKMFAMLLCMTMAFSLTACGKKPIQGGEDDDPSTIGEPVYVTIVDAGLGRAWMDDLAAAYYEETGISVEVSADPDLVSSVETKMNSATAETDDLYLVAQAPNLWLSYAAKDRIVPIDDVLEDTKYSEDGKSAKDRVVDDMALQMGKYLDDKTLTVPYVYTCWGFVYNQAYLDKIESFGTYKKGEFPKTLQGILDLCEATKKANIISPRTHAVVKPLSAGLNVNYMDQLFLSLWHQEDPDGYYAYFNQNDPSGFSTELFNTPAVKKAMKACMDIIGATSKTESNLVSSAQNHLESQQSFVNGDCVFTISGSWFECEMKNIMEDVNLTSYRFSDFPVYEEGKTPSLCINYPGENFFIPRNAENIAGAKDFLKFIMSDKGVAVAANSLKQSLLFKTEQPINFTDFGNDIQHMITDSFKIYRWSNSMVYRTGALGLFKMSTGPFTLMATYEVKNEKDIEDKIVQGEIRAHNAVWDDYMDLLP